MVGISSRGPMEEVERRGEANSKNWQRKQHLECNTPSHSAVSAGPQGKKKHGARRVTEGGNQVQATRSPMVHVDEKLPLQGTIPQGHL